jgi:predicted esterase
MHGWGSNAFDLISLGPYIAGGRCLMLCPQGPVEVEIGAVNGYGWYQLRTRHRIWKRWGGRWIS